MSEKVRVMFDVPNVIKKDILRKPVEITIDDYVRLRMAEHNGDTEALAQYIKNRYYKPGTSLSGYEVSMTAAVGNPFHIMLIDQAIDEGRNPLEDMKRPLGSDEDKEANYSTNAIDDFIIKYLPFWKKFSKDTRHKIWIVIGIVCIILTLFICATSIDSDKTESDKQTPEEKLEDVKNNAADVWNNIKSIGNDNE